jgi:molybdate transport system ATP-binding protein
MTITAPPATSDVLIRLERVNVALNGRRVLHDLSWVLRRGEHWAVLGPNGAGKSTFLRLLRGEIWPAPVNGGSRHYYFDGRPTTSPIGIPRRMALVSAEQQQRYLRVHTRWDAQPMQARDVVFTGLLGSECVTRRPTCAEQARVAQAMDALGIQALADALIDRLSQGQLRKVLIARALVGDPDVLILDEVGVGLDARSRNDLYAAIQRMAAQGIQLLITTHRRDEIIPAITHVMELTAGRITWLGRREALNAPARHRQGPVNWRTLDPATIAQRAAAPPPFLVNIVRADVATANGDAPVLRGVTWRINPGEHWAILGDNGAGKSTLLRLILGELWPAHGGAIARFADQAADQARTLSVWEVKRRIGYVSCEFQARYYADLTAAQVVASGFFASVGWLQPLSRAQKQRVRETLDLFNLLPLADRSILEMSYGQARKVLIARALVNAPRLLILDEVFDGLDAQARAELAGILQQLASQTSVLLVTHHAEDILPFITHRLVLDGGRIASQEYKARHQSFRRKSDLCSIPIAS